MYWSYYRNDPLQIIDLRDGGFLAWPGVIALILGALPMAGAARRCASR
jgi:prolipoprotein diacylglyceryltransferase